MAGLTRHDHTDKELSCDPVLYVSTTEQLGFLNITKDGKTVLYFSYTG